jgi:hypothetical protein
MLKFNEASHNKWVYSQVCELTLCRTFIAPDVSKERSVFIFKV